MTLIHLVRHGEVHNPANIRYGRLRGYHLSTRGEQQARATGAYVRGLGRPVAAILTSPLERAVETAEILRREIGGPEIRTEDGLLEAQSRFDGLPRTAWMTPWRWPDLWTAFKNPLEPSWGEAFDDVARRMRKVVEDLQRRTRSGATVVLVSHQSPIWLLRQSFESRRPLWLSRVRCSYASVTSLEFVADCYGGHAYWAPT